MISPLDTHIAYFGSTTNVAVTEALAKLRGAGYDIISGSHDPRDAPMLRALGIPYVPDRVEALSDCQVVLTSLPTIEVLEDLYFGDQGLIEFVDPGTYLVDLSFSTPQFAREVHALASASDVYSVDAPLVNLGEHEQSIAFIGGSEEVRSELSPLFPYLASTVMPQGDVGEGQFAAMISYISLAGSLMGVIEAMALARVTGFSDKAALGAIAASSGGSRALIDYAPRILAHDYSGRLKVIEFLDALEMALYAADQLELTLPAVETAYQLYDLLSVVKGDELNLHALALLYESEETCAKFGLDWALADEHVDMDAYDEEYDIEEFLIQQFGDGGEEADGSSDDSSGGYPSIGGLFSKN